jgi:hypothetical protein
MIRATVSGSFHRHMAAIADAVATLGSLGVEVLSPADPRVVDADGDFLFVASDKLRSRKLVEDRHLEAIRHSDFLWVVCPDGYTGASTSGEILAAAVLKKPVFSTESALDITIGDYVEKVGSMGEAITKVRQSRKRPPFVAHALLQPEALSETAAGVDALRYFLTAERGDGKSQAERHFAQVREDVSRRFGLGLPH